MPKSNNSGNEGRLSRFKLKVRDILNLGPTDYGLFFTVLLLNIYGIIMIYSSSYYAATTKFKQASTYFVGSQISYVFGGVVVLLILSAVDYHFYVKLGLVGCILSFVCIFLLKSPIGSQQLGAYRWLKFGQISFQAVEPVKLGMICFAAWFVKNKGLCTTKLRIIFLGITIVLAGLIFSISNNLSAAIILAGMMYIILLASSDKLGFYLGVLLVAVAAAVIAVFFIDKFLPYSAAENFRITRIRAWLHPKEYAADESLQLMQALYAIGSGGIWGRGLGQSLVKFKLPYAYNDFIFAIICEELGLFGACLMLMLFGYMLYRIFRIALSAQDIEGKVLCVGVFAHILLQLLVNVMVVVGIFPTTGVTLPFFSAGGSSVIFTLAELGFVMSVDRYSKRQRYHSAAVRHVEQREQRKNMHSGARPKLLITDGGRKR